MSANNHGEHGHPEGGHEKTDLAYGPLLWIVPSSVLLVILFTALVVFLSTGAASDEMSLKQTQGIAVGRETLVAVRAHEDSLLTTYGRDTAGHVRIPVARAMEILAQNYASTHSAHAHPKAP